MCDVIVAGAGPAGLAAGSCVSTIKDIISSCVGDGAAVAIQVRLYVSYILNS